MVRGLCYTAGDTWAGFLYGRMVPVAQVHVELPPEFTVVHEHVVTDYLADRVVGRAAWTMVFTAFDLLARAILVTSTHRISFRALYLEVVDQPLADAYIEDLLTLGDVRQESPALWARYARRIVQQVAQRGWRSAADVETRLLLAYLLYWWGAFARGYALEAEVFRDRAQSGVMFAAHELRDRQQRFSPSDLTVLGMAGDIKTSVYFVHAATPLAHDFYIVRLVVQGQLHTLVVLLQPEAWEEFNGDTVPGDLTALAQHVPSSVMITHGVHRLVMLDYNEWKRRVLRRQGAME